LIAVNTSRFAGRVARLNFFPPSGDVQPDFWVGSTDGDLLLANALDFVVAVPEPGGLTLAGLAALSLIGYRRRRGACSPMPVKTHPAHSA
jgi:hypothetical protein